MRRIYVKKEDLKWYKRLWNILTGHKEKNYTTVWRGIKGVTLESSKNKGE